MINNKIINPEDDFSYSNEAEEEMGQLHAIHNNMNAVAAVQRKLAEQSARPGVSHCIECGEEIPKARRMVVMGVQYCAPCQEYFERKDR